MCVFAAFEMISQVRRFTASHRIIRGGMGRLKFTYIETPLLEIRDPRRRLVRYKDNGASQGLRHPDAPARLEGGVTQHPVI
jgi:hypothetical protein